MKQSKFSLADVLTVIGTLIFGFVCFLSLNFRSLGIPIRVSAVNLIQLEKSLNYNFKGNISLGQK